MLPTMADWELYRYYRISFQPLLCSCLSVCLVVMFVQMVIKYEIDPNGEDKVGNTPAHLAAAEGHLECLKVLVYHRRQPLEVVTSRNNNVSSA